MNSKNIHSFAAHREIFEKQENQLCVIKQIVHGI
jgi:hypothetical protein